MSDNPDATGIQQLYEQIKGESENLKRTQLLDQTFKFLLKRTDQIPKLICVFIEKIDYGDLMLCHWLLDRLPALLPHMKGKPEVNELMTKVLDIILLQFKHKKFPPAFLVQTSCFVIRFLMDQIRDNSRVSSSLAQPLKTLIDLLLNVPLTDMQIKIMMIKCFQTMIVSLSGVGSDLKFKAANPGFDNIPFHEKSQQVLKYLEKGLSNDRSFNVLTAIINAFAVICLERPPYSEKIIDLVLNFYNSPPSYLNGFQLKCVQKSIKVQIINLHKHNRNNQFNSKLTKAAEEFLRSNSTTQSPPTDPYISQTPQPTSQTQPAKHPPSRPPYPEKNQHNAPRPQRPQQIHQQAHTKSNYSQNSGPTFLHQQRPMNHRGGQFIPRPPLPQHLRPPLPPPPPFQRPPPPLSHDFPPNPQFMHMHQPNPIPYPQHHEYPPEKFNDYPPYEEYDQTYYHPEHPPQDPMIEYDEHYDPYSDTNYPPFADNMMTEQHLMNPGYPDQNIDYYPDAPHQDWPSHAGNVVQPPNHQLGYDPHPISGPSTPPFAQSHHSPPTIVHESRRQNFTQSSNEELEEFERPLSKQSESLDPPDHQQVEQLIKPTPEPSIQTPSEATATPQPSVIESDRRESQSPTMVAGEDFTENNTLIDSIPSSPSVEEVEEEFQLTENWINSIKSLSFKRLLQKGTHITSKGKSDELIGLDWMVLSSRIASLKPLTDTASANQSQNLRKIMFEFISFDFKTNLALMLNWMLEEFYKWGISGDSDKPSSYSYWLHKLLDEINPPPPDIKYISETKESKLVAPILLNIPILTDHCFEWLWKWCESPQCTLTGFHCLRELLYNRPATRGAGLEKLLSYSVSTDHLFRNAAIDTSQRLAINCPSITESIVSFAIKSFNEVDQVRVPNCLKTLEDMANEMKQKQLEKELESRSEEKSMDSENETNEENDDSEALVKSPKSTDQKKRDFEMIPETVDDTSKDLDEDPSQAKAKYDLEIIRRSELYCGIVAKKPELVKEFLNSFNKACSQVQDSLQRKLKILINELGGDNQYLLESIEEYISTAPNMVFNILNTLVEKGNVADELITTLKQIYKKGELFELNWNFLDTVLPKLNKKQIYQFIPIIVGHINQTDIEPEKSREKIKDLLLTLLDPHKDADGNAKFKNPLTPVDLLVQLHLLTVNDEVEKFNEAIQTCINNQSTFAVDSIAETLKYLVDQPQLPILLVQTMIKSVKVYSQLTSPINGLLLKLIQNHAIWTRETLWKDFIECCKLTTPQSFNVLLQLPKKQLEEVIVNHNELLLGLSKHIKNKMNHNQQMRVYALLPMLDVRPAASSKLSNKGDNRDGKQSNKEGNSSKDRRSRSQTNKRQRSDTHDGKPDTTRDPSTDSKKSRTRGH